MEPWGIGSASAESDGQVAGEREALGMRVQYNGLSAHFSGQASLRQPCSLTHTKHDLTCPDLL